MLMFLTDPSTWRSNVESRSKIRYLGARAVGKGLPKLLTDPRRGGMFGDISAEDLAAPVADHEEHVEQSE